MSTENKYARVLAATKTESILAVIAGLPVDANGFFLSEAQMSAIEEALSENKAALQTAEANLQANVEQGTALAEERNALQASLATANETIAAKETEIGNLNAKITELENETPQAQNTKADADKTGDLKVKKESAMDAFADKLLGTPKPKQA